MMWILAKLTLAIVAALLLIVVLMVGSTYFGLNDEVDGSYDFDPSSIPEDLDRYLLDTEGQVPNLRHELRKQIVWAGEAGKKQDLAIVYFHGFSGSNHELQPVPQRVAKALGANLYLGRWTGHGRDGDAMGEARTEHWMVDAAEALEIGSRIGDKVILMGTSFGGSMSVIAASDPEMTQKIDGLILTVPNFGLQNPLAPILTLPGVRSWGPIVAGEYREFEPKNELHAKYWTPKYPNQASISLGHITKFVRSLRYEDINQPTLIVFSDSDTVVRPEATRAAASRFGGSVELELIAPGEGIDPDGHVITGDNLSPGSTEFVIDRMIRWIEGR